MIGGEIPHLETAHGIAVAVRLSDPGLREEVHTVLAGISGFVLVASSDAADVVVTDLAGELDDVAAVVIGDAASIAAAVERGAAGLLPHQIDRERLRIAVEAVHQGLVCMPRSAAIGSAAEESRFENPGHETATGQLLSARERQVLDLMAGGASNKLIARRLAISVHTAKFHVASVTAKLGAGGRTEAVALAIRQGLIHL